MSMARKLATKSKSKIGTTIVHRTENLPEHREKTLYVGNMDKRLTEYQLIKLFEPFGEIVRCQYLWHHVGDLKGTPRGYSFIEFETKEQAEAAKAKLDNHMVLGRKMIIRFAEEKDRMDMQFKTLAERRKEELQRAGGVRITTEDKIRAIEQKLAHMQPPQHQQQPHQPPAAAGGARKSKQERRHNPIARPDFHHAGVVPVGNSEASQQQQQQSTQQSAATQPPSSAQKPAAPATSHLLVTSDSEAKVPDGAANTDQSLSAGAADATLVNRGEGAGPMHTSADVDGVVGSSGGSTSTSSGSSSSSSSSSSGAGGSSSSSSHTDSTS